MAAINGTHSCLICSKISTKHICRGCENHFCSKHFQQHKQELVNKFHNEVIESHKQLLHEIEKLEESNALSSDLFAQIEQWKNTTIERVEQAAEQVRDDLIILIEKPRIKITTQYELVKAKILALQEEESLLENDIEQLKFEINEIQHALNEFTKNDLKNHVVIDNDVINWNQLIRLKNKQSVLPYIPNTNPDDSIKWALNGITVAGGHGAGNRKNQLYNPLGLRVDQHQTMYIAEYMNHRVMEWHYRATIGQVLAGGNGDGNHLNQLKSPRDVVLDRDGNHFIIADNGNRRVMRWSRHNFADAEVLISNIGCWGLALDNDGFLYVVDNSKHQVKKYRIGESQGTVVAGGNGPGSNLDQLDNPRYVFIDTDYSVYVSDTSNHRVVKWTIGAKEGIVVAGGHGSGHGLSQLSNPNGIIVDQLGNLLVADSWNHRIMCWHRGATYGRVIIGGYGRGNQSNQFMYPIGLSSDDKGNLFISDFGNHRIQMFYIDQRF